jgi:hypothetical protein
MTLPQWKLLLRLNRYYAATRVTMKCTRSVTERDLIGILHDLWSCIYSLDIADDSYGTLFSSFLITTPTIDNLKGNIWCGSLPEPGTGLPQSLLILSVYRNGRRTQLGSLPIKGRARD